MKNLQDIISQRRSIRKYTNQPISKEVIEQLLESARLSPSACNLQPWMFYVCESEQAKTAVRESYPREWFNAAQTYIVICGNHDQSWKRAHDGKDHCDIDIAIATEHICLAAACLGVGTCWVCNFDAAKLKADMQLPQHLEPIVILPLGYPAETPETRKRKPMNEISTWI